MEWWGKGKKKKNCFYISVVQHIGSKLDAERAAVAGLCVGEKEAASQLAVLEKVLIFFRRITRNTGKKRIYDKE